MGQRHKRTEVPSDFNVYTNLETTVLLLNEFYELCYPWNIIHKLLKYYLK